MVNITDLRVKYLRYWFVTTLLMPRFEFFEKNNCDMKIIINTINIYHIHDNNYNTCGYHFKANRDKMDDTDLRKFSPAVVVNENLNNNDHPLIAQLEARMLESEREKKELLDWLHRESK